MAVVVVEKPEIKKLAIEKQWMTED